jgi:hypothetical protein
MNDEKYITNEKIKSESYICKLCNYYTTKKEDIEEHIKIPPKPFPKKFQVYYFKYKNSDIYPIEDWLECSWVTFNYKFGYNKKHLIEYNIPIHTIDDGDITLHIEDDEFKFNQNISVNYEYGHPIDLKFFKNPKQAWESLYDENKELLINIKSINEKILKINEKEISFKTIKQKIINVPIELTKFKSPDWAISRIYRYEGDEWIVEDTCEHGVGHPNVEWLLSLPEDKRFGIHGCCGYRCCHKLSKNLIEKPKENLK